MVASKNIDTCASGAEFDTMFQNMESFVAALLEDEVEWSDNHVTSSRTEKGRQSPQLKHSSPKGSNNMHKGGASSVSHQPPRCPGAVTEAGRIFVTKVPQYVTEQNLIDYFSQFGELKNVHVPPPHKAGFRHKGMAFLSYALQSDVDAVLARKEYEVMAGVHVIVDKANVRADGRIAAKEHNNSNQAPVPSHMMQKRLQGGAASSASSASSGRSRNAGYSSPY